MFHDQTRWMRRAIGTAAVGGALALALAGPVGAQTSNQTNRSFVNGSVTSVHGTAVQVTNQTQNSESTVTLSPTTQIAKSESATASAITTGTCVRVIGTGSAPKGITARTVAISQATSNGCGGGGQGAGGAGGRRFGNGQRPNFGNGSGSNGTRRFPNGGNFANLAIANGPVVSVSGDKVVVKSTTFARPATTSTKTKSKSKSSSTKTQTTRPKATTSNVTVTLTSSTTISQTVTGSAADVAVGSCVTATGTTAGAGITADRVNVSSPVNGACTGGFGGFGRGGFGGGNGGGGNGQV
jgi:hypothetical protein